MQRLSVWMDFIAKNILRIIMGCVLAVGLVIKPMYAPEDYPYFQFMEPLDFLLLIFLGALTVWGIKNWSQIEAHVDCRIAAAIYGILALIFVLMVPLKPFSDMQYVYEAAIDFAAFDWENLTAADYWRSFPGNVKVGIMWGILLLPFPRTLLTIKIYNAVFVYLNAVFTKKLCEQKGIKCSKLVFLMTLFFTPLLLYTNHVYFDLPVLLLGTIGLYVYYKDRNIVGATVFFTLARLLRKNSEIFLLAVIIDYVFHLLKMKNKKSQIVKLLAALLLYEVVSSNFSSFMVEQFYPADYKAYPGANQFYIGINEEEFGFMDGDFSYDRTMQDVWDRIAEYGPIRMTKILSKKVLWTWMQGTYQAQRYGFGNDVDAALDKFEYETPVTGLLLADEQPLRCFFNSFMRTQYIILFALMLFTLFKKKNMEDMRVFYYILTATFLALVLYEMKSRYILYCFPVMMVLAGWTMEHIGEKDESTDII